MTTLNISNIGKWLLRLISSIILLQTLYFKFTGAPESVFIFNQLGMEPWGRIGIGIMELIAAILILYPRTIALGGLLAMGLMSGALFFHFSILGIEVQNDGGQLFVYALLVFVTSLVLVLIYRKQIFSILPFKPFIQWQK